MHPGCHADGPGYISHSEGQKFSLIKRNHTHAIARAHTQDLKTFGHLKDDPLTADEAAFPMKYSAEDTDPKLYADTTDTPMAMHACKFGAKCLQAHFTQFWSIHERLPAQL